jgi:EAL domain-containing protein (putative c-di-GMP-specific phosphodiesterase class I)
MLDSPVDMQIVKLIIEWGRRFNLLTVAEGVENQQVLNILCELGCSFAQGTTLARHCPKLPLCSGSQTTVEKTILKTA